MNTTPSNQDIALSLATAIGKLDLPALANLLADDFVLHVPGKNPLSGDRRGMPGFLDFLAATQKLSAGQAKTEVLDLMAGKNHATLYTLTQAQRPGHTPLINYSLLLLRLSEGKVLEAWFHNRDQGAVDAFWS